MEEVESAKPALTTKKAKHQTWPLSNRKANMMPNMIRGKLLLLVLQAGGFSGRGVMQGVCDSSLHFLCII